jgi:DNA-binding response OmpR family regulator
VYTDLEWTLQSSLTVESALGVLRRNSFPLIVCERDLQPGSWREMLADVSLLPDPPLMIVTSRLADEYLWAEALNLGAYDVLAKPFDTEEVIRVLSLASLHWNHAHEIQGSRTKAMVQAANGS